MKYLSRFRIFLAEVVERNKTLIVCTVYFIVSLPLFETVKLNGVLNGV
jgi:hypothetical protein